MREMDPASDTPVLREGETLSASFATAALRFCAELELISRRRDGDVGPSLLGGDAAEIETLRGATCIGGRTAGCIFGGSADEGKVWGDGISINRIPRDLEHSR